MGVVVQRLVPAEVAGILFTADPVSGARDRAVITASWGLGEAVVGGKVTPDSIAVHKDTGAVVSRETANKQAMVVRIDSGTADRAVPDVMRRVPVLSDEQASELVRLGQHVESIYGQPMDVEWTLLDGAFALVQARPITALPEPEPAPPRDWVPPVPKAQYMRGSIVDLMPGPLSPLYATMGLSAINRALRHLAEDVFDAPAECIPEEIMETINGYAYMRTSYTSKEMWLMVTRLVPKFPKMMREGLPYWQDVAYPRYACAVARWETVALDELDPGQLIEGARAVAAEAADHLGVLMASTMGPSAGTELLFTQTYNRLVRRPGDPAAPTFLLGFESKPVEAEKALFDLALWCKEQPGLSSFLEDASASDIAALVREAGQPTTVSPREWGEFRGRFGDYMGQYGYSVYTLDFANELPMDNPAPWLAVLKLYLSGGGKNPHERQRAFADRRKRAIADARARLRGVKRRAFDKTLAWTQLRVPLREDGIASIGLGYPVLRRLLSELGSRMVGAGALAEAADVFWLEEKEIEEIVGQMVVGDRVAGYTDRVSERKLRNRAASRATPPAQVPYEGKYMGMNIETWVPVHSAEQVGGVIKGVGASPGTVTATARVLRGAADFDQMRAGDVLVAGITTPAWTPLFAMASAVVTDVGGPLSHGSIVAREYGIPAVMGTGVATARIQSGQVITVNGSEGTVHVSGGSSA